MKILLNISWIALMVLAVSAKEVEDDKKQNKRGIFDFGYGHDSFDSYEHNPHVITKTIHVPQPYPVTVEKKIPVPYKVPVDRPYPVHIPKPYPVHIEKPVPYKVDRPVPYPVKVPYKVPVYHKVEVPVPKPYPVPVDRPYPVPVPQPYIVEKKVPVYINTGGSHHHGSFDHSEHDFGSYAADYSHDFTHGSSELYGHHSGGAISSQQVTIHH